MTDDLKAAVADAIRSGGYTNPTIIDNATAEDLESASGVVVAVVHDRSLAVAYMDKGWGMLGVADGYVVHAQRATGLARVAPAPTEAPVVRKKGKTR